jgi:hypothetical protein
MKPRLFIYGPSSSGKTIFKNIPSLNEKYNIINFIDEYKFIWSYDLNVEDKIIYIFRDPRTCWLLSDDKLGGLYNVKKMIQDVNIVKFCEWYEHEFLEWTNFKEYDNAIMFKFEDVLLDYQTATNKVFNFLKIEEFSDIYKPDVLVPGKFTRFDMDKIVKYMAMVTQDDFEYISKRLKSILIDLGYPLTMDLKTITR